MAGTETKTAHSAEGTEARGAGLDGVEAGLDALGSADTGRPPLRQTLVRKVLPPITAIVVVLVLWQALITFHVVDDPTKLPSPADVAGATVILVDDGLATGSTMRAAVAAVRQQVPAKVVVAVPVAAPSTRDELAREVDDIVTVATPDPFLAVGRFYEDFDQTEDDEVHALLARAARRG